MNGRVPLTLACWDYDRTAALASGEVRPEGVDLTYLSLPVEETSSGCCGIASSTPRRCRCPRT